MTTKESKIDDFSEELGKLLGNARSKAEGWLGQRTQIAKTLEGIRDTASKLLSDLGHQAQRITQRGRPAGGSKRRSGTLEESPAPVRKRRKMSAEARAAISAAQKARWAKQKAAEKKIEKKK